MKCLWNIQEIVFAKFTIWFLFDSFSVFDGNFIVIEWQDIDVLSVRKFKMITPLAYISSIF